MFRLRHATAVTAAIAMLTAPDALTAQRPDRARLVATIDSIVNAPITAAQVAGISVAVVKGADTIVMKGYGWADLDLDTPTPPYAIYEIGSITKQFTTAALMQLVEQGTVNLDADLLTYLPTYPSRGQHIPVRRLLDHTSGIRSYTEIPAALKLFPLTVSHDSVMALVGNAGFDFSTGEALIYNNSAYFLAGMIIEKVTGQKYADYVKTNLFDRVGMPRSAYCTEDVVTKGKVHGYTFGGMLRKAEQQNHSWPFSAGSLCSTTGDLLAWLRALHTSDQVVTRASYREMITPGTLTDGYRVRYAKGLTNLIDEGRQVISHGGGISGYTSESRFYPADSLYIVVLTNTAGPVSPSAIAQSIAKAVLGPGTPLAAVSAPSDLTPYAGRFRGPGRGNPTDVRFAVEDGRLTVAGSPGRPLQYLGNDTFGVGTTRYLFLRDASRAVHAVRVDNVSVVSVAKRVR
ncbi:MAG: serine hydrolase domain-containing protein [Gemmatimonas sp.]|jgi:D-alanyl-D-alanine carboxypeptidase|uniref:serine hydrolase domain-containing protein n=1 Tax=Gemmatimonas sp. TaxID=1962908 RepID=UPI00391F9D8D|nr:beta-lactamase family protein [Gemmatimonadota bacterium]